ncbi:HNH endonuclease [Candidatus Viridilinea mediisalina]|uniref:HNH endonuclease n=1 Tax=Candidatus Viridilinea mediisalina TaxID=2024553 RepID=A0A2A6RLF5_9CHLR|nr:HNH endonuclease [Candidatus Viridilinea mediisalina]PDW03688.1 HNH endonuclease [Candidatus Viridilinea mediisalina]
MVKSPRISEIVRRQVAARAGERCEYCLSPAHYATQRFSIEHIIPRAKGGTQSLDNLALACQGCNNYKYDRVEAVDALSGELVPLYNPRRDHWHEHFAWSADGLLIIGLTPTGRVTVDTLDLNRSGVVNLRTLINAFYAHPPNMDE